VEPGIRRNVPVSLREPHDDAILRPLCGIGVEAGAQVIIVLKIAQLDLGRGLKSALLNEARLDRQDPRRRLAQCIRARVHGMVAKDEIVIVRNG
jgi:hypothetical protein